MTIPTTAPQGYSATQMALHWAVAVLVAGQYIFNDAISGAWDAVRAAETLAFDPLILAHVAGGVLILAFVAWRLVMRLRRGAPPPPENAPAPLKALSRIAHWAFHAVLGAMAVSGSLAWFGEVTQAAQAHDVLKVVLLALVVLHVLAVLFHHVVLKHNVLRRMVRPED